MEYLLDIAVSKLSTAKKCRIRKHLRHSGAPDYAAMGSFISAVQKLVIKDVVQYADSRIAATKDAVGR